MNKYMSQLTYEDCKELKDAGFKSYHQMDMDTGSWCVNCSWNEDRPEKGFKDMCFPSLEELINACGNKFHGIYTRNKEWVSHGFLSKKEFDDKYCYGSTPSQAVKNLWIAINTNK